MGGTKFLRLVQKGDRFYVVIDIEGEQISSMSKPEYHINPGASDLEAEIKDKIEAFRKSEMGGTFTKSPDSLAKRIANQIRTGKVVSVIRAIPAPAKKAKEAAKPAAQKPKEPEINEIWIRTQMRYCISGEEKLTQPAILALASKANEINAFLKPLDVWKSTTAESFALVAWLTSGDRGMHSGFSAFITGKVGNVSADAKKAVEQYLGKVGTGKGSINADALFKGKNGQAVAGATLAGMRAFFAWQGKTNSDYAAELKNFSAAGGTGAFNAADVLAVALFARRITLQASGPIPVLAPEGRATEGVKKAAEPIKPPEKELTPLEKYLKGCSVKLAGYIREGKPEEIVKFKRNLPTADKDVDRAALLAGEAYQMELIKPVITAFMGMAQGDTAFKSFLHSRGSTTIVQIAGQEQKLMLRPNMMEAITLLQQFLNMQSNRQSGNTLAAKLDDDLRVLNVNYLDTMHQMKADGVASLRLIAALAVYTWRMENKNLAGGAWAHEFKEIKPVKKPDAVKAIEGI